VHKQRLQQLRRRPSSVLAEDIRKELDAAWLRYTPSREMLKASMRKAG